MVASRQDSALNQSLVGVGLYSRYLPKLPNMCGGLKCVPTPQPTACAVRLYSQKCWPDFCWSHMTRRPSTTATPPYLVMSVDARPSASRRRAPWTATLLLLLLLLRVCVQDDEASPAWYPIPMLQAVLRDGCRKLLACDGSPPVSTKTLKQVMIATRFACAAELM